MAEQVRKGIDKEIGLVPAGSITELGGRNFLADDDEEYTVSVSVPAGGAEPVVLTGKCASRTVRVSAPGGEERRAPTLKTDLSVLGNIQDLLNYQVEVVVAADGALIEDLPGVPYIDATCKISRKQIAVENAAGNLTVYWDPRLDFPLITLADPLFHYSGTYFGLLETLIAPYKFSDTSLAEILIESDSVRVVYLDGSLQDVTSLNIGSDIFLDDLSIRRSRPKQLQKVSASWYEPKVLKETTKTLVDERFDKDGFVIGKTVRTLRMIGNVLLEEQELNYVQLIINWVISGGPIEFREGQQEPLICLQYRKITTYTYDPVPNELNVHYIRNFKLTERHTKTTYFMPSTEEEGQIVWREEEELSSYSYTEDGKLSCETQRTAKNREGYVEDGYVQGEITEIKYSPISEDMYQLSKSVSKFHAYTVSGGEIWPKPGDLSPLSHLTQTIMGSLPSPPSIPIPKNEDYIENKDTEKELSTSGAVAHMELPFNPGRTFDLFVERMTSAVVRVSISGRCLYDLRPGLWIRLGIAKDVSITTKSSSGSEETTKVSDLLSSLPDLLVRSVDVKVENKEQITMIEAVGWVPTRTL